MSLRFFVTKFILQLMIERTNQSPEVKIISKRLVKWSLEVMVFTLFFLIRINAGLLPLKTLKRFIYFDK